jgi:O-antigen/teichoic acid export membrane protein
VIRKLRRKFERQLQDKSFEEVLRGSAIIFTSRVSETFFTMVTSIFIARVYGAEVVGSLAAIRAVMEIMTIFCLAGTDVSLLRLIPQYRKISDRSASQVYLTAVKMVGLISLVLSVALYFGAHVLADALNKPHLGAFYALAAYLILPKTLFKLNLEGLRGLKQHGSVAMQNISLAVVTLTALVVMTLIMLNKYIPVTSYLITLGITAAVSTWLVFDAFRKIVRKDQPVERMSMRSMLTVSAPMFMTKSAFLVLGYADVLMITYFMSEADVGYYQVAWKLIMFNKFFKNSITSTAAPKMAELYHGGEMKELERVAKKTTMLMGYTIFPMLLTLMLFGKPILGGLYGPEFMAGYAAFLWLGVAQLITASVGHVGMFMNMCGRQKLYMNIVLISAIINLVGNWLLIPRIGIEGAAISNVASVLFNHLVATIYIKRIFGFTVIHTPLLNRLVRLFKPSHKRPKDSEPPGSDGDPPA